MNYNAENTFSFTRSEERVNKLINGLWSGILLQGPKTEMLFSNKAALDLLGLSADELFGRTSFHPDWNVIREDGSVFPNEEQPVPACIRTKRTITNVVMGVYRPKTADRVWLLVNAEPLLTEEGEVQEVICSFSDITDRKKSEEKLNWLYQRLEIRAFELATTNADLERFVYVATHDLQEPLRLVSSFTQLLKRKYEKQLDEKALEYINYAAAGATRMKKLIEGLLEFSSCSNNREAFKAIDMNNVLQGAIAKFSKEIREKGAEVLVRELPVIHANSYLMTQLFENLISNALNYQSTLKPVIQINCKDEKDHFLFSVSDNGIGIDPDYFNKIFILFQRLHNNNETNEGVGAGLAICKKIAELHRGTIHVVSEQGKGSTFYITISKMQDQPDEKV